MKRHLFNVVVVITFAASMILLFFAERHEEQSLLTSSFGNVETVILDAGHGGEDGGAVGNKGILEKEINLAVSQKLELILNLFGVSTDMTRREDVSLSDEGLAKLRYRKISDIKMRVEKVVNTPNSILISIHQNSFPQDKNCSGAQVFFSANNTESEMLAKNTQTALKNGINKNNARKPKVAGENIYILDNVNCPAILVECGFLTNEEESQLLMTDIYRTKLAVCIASGFFEYQAIK